MWEGNVFSISVCPQGRGRAVLCSSFCHQMSGPRSRWKGGGGASHIFPNFATRCQVQGTGGGYHIVPHFPTRCQVQGPGGGPNQWSRWGWGPSPGGQGLNPRSRWGWGCPLTQGPGGGGGGGYTLT